MTHDRILTKDMAYAVGRFDPSGVIGYRAATAPNAPLRPTRAEAIEDEARYLDELAASDPTR